MNSLPVNVVLLPNPELASKAISASESLGRLEGYFTLKDGKFFPHISLYMLQLGQVSIDDACRLLQVIASDTDTLSLVAHRYDVNEKHHFIDAEYQKSQQLAGLQMQVVEALNPIRAGMREKDKVRMLEASGLARDNFEKYGWNSVGNLYRPHLTFTRFRKAEPAALGLLPDVRQFSGEFGAIGLFEMGDHGTCIRKIAKFSLAAQEIVIVPAQAKHAEGIAKVQRETWLAAYPNEAAGITRGMIEARVKTYESPERIARWREIIASTEHVSVALSGERVVGFSSAKRANDINHLAAIYVLPEYQGMGIAQKLMDAAMAWLGNDKDILVEVVSYNDRAIRFYEKVRVCGYG